MILKPILQYNSNGGKERKENVCTICPCLCANACTKQDVCPAFCMCMFVVFLL